MKEDKDKCKYSYCKITEEECTRQHCTTCTYGKDELKSELENYNDLTTFVSCIRNDITYEKNLFDTVAKSDKISNIVLALDPKNKWTADLKPLDDFNENDLLKTYPHHVIVVEALKLPKASKYYYSEDLPLISVHDNVVLASAPRIEDDE